MRERENINSFKIFFTFTWFMCLTVLTTDMYVYHKCAWCPCRPAGGIRDSRTGITDDYVLSCEFYRLNIDPIQEQKCAPNCLAISTAPRDCEFSM